MFDEAKYQLSKLGSRITGFPVIKQIYRVIAWWGKKLYSNYKKSKLALTAFLFSTALFIVLIPSTVVLAYETAVYSVTRNTDTFFLSNAEEFEPNKYNVRGCQGVVCNKDNTVYFRIEQSPFSIVHSYVKNGTMFYPDYLGAAVAPGINKCKVDYYGFRAKFLVVRNMYPNVLDLECEFVTNESSS